ncbi:MAG: GH3 domain-containing protein [Planctomycetota bacterium]|jgi:hypothetical protein
MKLFVRSQRRALDRLLKKRALASGFDSPEQYLGRMPIRVGPPTPPLREPDRSFRRWLWLDERARAADEADTHDLRLLVGTPPETLAAIERVEQETGRAIRDAWPSFRKVIHGGVEFAPFADALRLRCGAGIRFVEIIRPALGITLAVRGRLRPEKRVYFEFIPQAGGEARAADSLHSGVPYRVLVTDGDAYWRHDGGCVVRFDGPRHVVSLANRLDVGGFGERLSRDDVEGARGPAQTLALVPEYPTATQPFGRYRIEADYESVPPDLAVEGQRIDAALMEACAGYRRLREASVLRPPWLRLASGPTPEPSLR